MRNRWRSADPRPIIFGIVALLLVLLGVIQYLAVHCVLLAANLPGKPLNILDYLGLWGTNQPGERTGAPGWDDLHMTFVVLFSITILTAVILGIVLWRKRVKNPEYLPGLASMSDVVKHAGERQLLTRARGLRPSLLRPTATDVGFQIATFRRTPVWVSVEDPMILVGPSRSGKGFYFVVKMIINAPGAVVTTSCRVDNVKLALNARKKDGRSVHIFGPGVESVQGLGHELRWNLITGCDDYKTLERRIEALVPRDSYGAGTTNGGHWDILGRQLASALFHAAALGDKTVDDIWGWVVNAVRADEALEIIRGDPRGLPEHADRLAAVLNLDAEKREVSWGTLATVLAWLGSRSVREWLKPEPGHNFDIPAFLLNRGTLFLVGNEDGSGGYQQVVGGLVAEIDYVADGIASAMPGSRLDPSVSFILDEAANFHIATLPKLISAGGGSGKQVLAVFQSRSQMAAWGPANDRAMWDAAAIKVVLPGGSDEQDLRALSALIGETSEVRESWSQSDNGGSSSFSEQERSIMTAANIRTMPKGTALIFHREMKPIVGRLSSWLTLPEAPQMKESEKALSLQMRQRSQYATQVDEQIAKGSR